MAGITERILRQLGCEDLLERLQTLPPSDLNALLLEVFRMEARQLSMAALMRSQQNNRFVAPAAADPIAYHRLEADVLAWA